MKKLTLLFVVIAACTSTPQSSGHFVEPTDARSDFPDAPTVPDGALAPAVENELGSLLASIKQGGFDSEAVAQVGAGGDPRVGWLLADLMRFFQTPPAGSQLARAFEDATGTPIESQGGLGFVEAFNLLMAWDLPAWDGYDGWKQEIYTLLEPGWAPFFEDNVAIDWRLVTWGGVLIDDRPLGDTEGCVRGCIPALDDPPTVSGGDVTWLADSDVVFGVALNGESLALPRNQMEVHEMVNLTLAGHRLGIPYCTLCGSAQAYLTDSVPEGFPTSVLRTSGLLSRSNKVMYDLETKSVFDTFTGEALSGPLGEAGATLHQVTVVASTWGEWLAAHPRTRVIAEDGGIGRTYSRDPLGDRDANGPIFPVGPVDPRLPVQERVVGVIAPDGTPVAFPVEETREALIGDAVVGYDDISVALDGDGLRVEGPDGEVPAHEAFWFAWSQFNPETLVWSSTSGP